VSTAELLRQAQSGDQQAKTQLVEENVRLIWSVVRRFLGRGAEEDDLFQLGCMGFLKAIDGFDPAYGTQFSTYAVPKIAGEMRRYLRDNGPVKLGRGLQEQNTALWKRRQELLTQWGREPTLGELSAATGLTQEEVALSVSSAGPVLSLQAENEEGKTLADQLWETGQEEQLLEHLALREALERLPERQRMLVELRYFRDFTQQQTARVLQISQVQVSRLEKKAIGQLKELMKNPPYKTILSGRSENCIGQRMPGQP
jgi:RNA polymerase sporulation-specific sigma factor